MQVQTVDYLAPDCAQRFVESLRTTGFGVLKNHPISQSLVESIYQNWYEFFVSDEKHQYQYNVDSQDGYFPPDVSEVAKGHQVKDIKEYYHIYPWGQTPPELKAEAMSYYQMANQLATELLGWVESNTPAEIAQHYSMPLSKMIENSRGTLLRVLHYPPLTGEEEPGAIRAAAHEDINLLTILPAANEPGLQVKGSNDEWLDVPCDFGTLIINTGDMLQEASQGYFPSTTHRVINPSGGRREKSRISLPLFLHPNPNVVLSERYTADEYLQERLRELGVI
ncbi:isopenicillin N synthase family oxygenase [Endozoicomonas sp. SM1973]|uniref:2-oxoglutarate-dependent ethylene/succinate-forming enzyme n=1 Tax=Spartinivicinus marinus TaxID=2994442 RepID=A0A853I934_9GAMM|nr:isopenicillin N synthase family oxygenase [Spartinivicinus marinus]MCX4028501.1 isopenicillin N synthase family oxygenase [Spartinivicinus marinus]NYZ67168.1 isopenicillin N synthase family oxygenase [Spartinivicinus marinus]